MFNLKFAANYILHRFKSINRHGLHSPFVYRLVDKVIYDFSDKKLYPELQKLINPEKKLSRVQKLLMRLTADAAPQTILVAGEINKADELLIAKSAPQSQVINMAHFTGNNSLVKGDMIFIDAHLQPQYLLSYFEQCMPHVHEQTVMLLKNVHLHNITRQAWQSIKANSQVTVTVDLFWLSLVYFRKGQVKENFLIRY